MVLYIFKVICLDKDFETKNGYGLIFTVNASNYFVCAISLVLVIVTSRLLNSLTAMAILNSSIVLSVNMVL